MSDGLRGHRSLPLEIGEAESRFPDDLAAARERDVEPRGAFLPHDLGNELLQRLDQPLIDVTLLERECEDEMRDHVTLPRPDPRPGASSRPSPCRCPPGTSCVP